MANKNLELSVYSTLHDVFAHNDHPLMIYNSLAWLSLQILLMKEKFEIALEIAFEIAGAKQSKVTANNFEATEQGLNIFGDVSGHLSNFSFHFLFQISFWN